MEITTEIANLSLEAPHWQPCHITSHHDHSPPRTTYIKIKYHQLQANDLSNTRHPPIPCFTLGHTNHLVDILYHNPHDSHFPYLTSAHHIWSLLCQLPFIFFYDLSSSKSDVSQFLHDAYQVKILYYFTKKSEMGWYTYYIWEFELPN